MRPVKVVHLIPELHLGGAEAMLYKLLRCMDRSKVQSTVLSLSGEGHYGGPIRELGVPLHCTDSSLGSLSWVVRRLREEKPDILQTWLYKADLLGFAAAKMAGVPRLAWNLRCSDADFGNKKAAYQLLLRLLAQLSKRTDEVIVNSEAGRRHHERLGYRPKHWEVVANGFDTECFAPRPSARRKLESLLKVPEGAPLIGMVARFDRNKDHATFFSAAELLSKKVPEAHFVLVGSNVTDANPSLARMRESKVGRERFHLMGEREDIADILPGLTVFSLISVSEGFPNALGEAMSCALPCVATDVGDVRNLLDDTGYVIPPRDPTALSDAWGRLLKFSHAERGRIGALARARIARHFSIESVATRYEQIYSHLAPTESRYRP